MPDDINPERGSNGSQIHILLGDGHHMDRRYTIFGQLMKGADVLRDLRKGDYIKDIVIYVRER